MVNCKCGSKYVGETSLKVSTCLKQHQKSITDKKWDLSGISNHAQSCKKGFEWDRSSILKVEDRKFDRKVEKKGPTFTNLGSHLKGPTFTNLGSHLRVPGPTFTVCQSE